MKKFIMKRNKILYTNAAISVVNKEYLKARNITRDKILQNDKNVP